MKRIILIFFVLFYFGFSLLSQNVQPYKYVKKGNGYVFPNVVKINTLALPFSNLSVSYERAIIPRLTVSIGAGYKYASRAPEIIAVKGSIINANLEKVDGYSITPEVRYYLKTCEDGFMEGFYAGAYFRYSRYKTGAMFNYFPTIDQREDYTSDVVLDEYGIGLQLGYQLVLWERFNIDFMFFGPRLSSYAMQYEFEDNVSQEFLDDLSFAINEVLNNFEIDYQVDLEKQGNNKASAGFLFANMRFGIAFGFAF